MKRLAALLITIGVAVGCFRLSWWQWTRLEERRAANAVIQSRLSAPAVRLDLRNTPALPESLTHRRATAAGEFDFSREVVVLARSRRGVPGVHVVTPFRFADSSAILVERAWVPSPDAATVDLSAVREPVESEFSGILLPGASSRGVPADSRFPLRVRAIDTRTLSPLFPYPILSLTLRRSAAPLGSGLISIEAPTISEGSHLSYTVQWLAFGVIALVGGGILFVKSEK